MDMADDISPATARSAPPTADSPAPAPRGGAVAGAPGADIADSLRAARELGPDYDDAIAAAIVERLDRAVDERVGHRLAETGGDAQAPGRTPDGNDRAWSDPRLVMGLLGMCFVIPLSAIAGSFMGAPGVILAWVGTLLFYLVSVIGIRR
ncbi:hypothetical protein GCM10023224_10460 [Streptomonospora halophila]|uniref:DUF1707 domain-containing protein n=2 Tax=Streptomonospora halophila TaxID=427369 RepID=A0ABP9G824_9ACTN